MTLYDRAQRYLGIREVPGSSHHPLIQWWHSLCHLGMETPDEVPWCSSFVNGVCWDEQVPRSYSAAARSWLTVGRPLTLDHAQLGYDVVIFKRGPTPQPGPEVTSGAPGHVGFFAGREGEDILVLGGNQGNRVGIARYPAQDLLGVRRLQG